MFDIVTTDTNDSAGLIEMLVVGGCDASKFCLFSQGLVLALIIRLVDFPRQISTNLQFEGRDAWVYEIMGVIGVSWEFYLETDAGQLCH